MEMIEKLTSLIPISHDLLTYLFSVAYKVMFCKKVLIIMGLGLDSKKVL